MDDGAGIHQRARERVAAAVHARVGHADGVDRLRGLACRIDAGGQADRADRDVDLALAMLARQVGQGAGLGPGHVGAVASLAHGARHHVAAEGAGRQEHHLAVDQVRRHGARDEVLRDGRGRQHDELGIAQRRADVGGGQRDRHLAHAARILEHDAAAVDDRLQRGRVAAP